MKKIIFFNREENQCGVHQYGLDTYNSISKIQEYEFSYKNVKSFQDIQVELGKYDLYIYNYSPVTMDFVNKDASHGDLRNLALLHENYGNDANSVNMSFFSHYVMANPCIVSDRLNFFVVPRNIPLSKFEFKLNAIPTFGTFGFATPNKGHANIFKLIQEQFDEAIIKINCPDASFYKINLSDYENQLRGLIYKPGVKLEFTTNFMTPSETIEFLSKNDVNVFLYNYMQDSGIASSLDYAIAANRPIAITKSSMFRHVLKYSFPITVEDNSLKDIINNGLSYMQLLQKEWTEEKFITAYKQVFKNILGD